MNEKLERLYRLMVLYMVKNSIRSLTNTEIMTFFVDKKYLDYFSIQEVIYNLIDTGHLIDVTNKENKTTYFLTELGEEALKQLNDFIPPAIVQDLNQYKKSNFNIDI